MTKTGCFLLMYIYVFIILEQTKVDVKRALQTDVKILLKDKKVNKHKMLETSESEATSSSSDNETASGNKSDFVH